MLLAAPPPRERCQEPLLPGIRPGGPAAASATGLDRDESSNVFGSLAVGRLSIRGGAVSRRKQVQRRPWRPSSGTAAECDRRSRVLQRDLREDGTRWLVNQGAAEYDDYGYEGFYPLSTTGSRNR